MADTKLSALSTTSTVSGSDKLYKIDGTPSSQAITATNLIHGLLTLSPSSSRTDLGLGNIATQAASSVTITGGAITGITDLAVADGGTGASTAAGARTNLQVSHWHPGFRTGYYYGHPASTTTAAGSAVTANQLYAIPVFVPETVTITKVALFVTTGAASSNVRLGLYNCAAGVPTSLVIDGGTASTAGSSTTPSVTISQSLSPGWYFIAAVFDGTPTIRVATANRGTILGMSTVNGNGVTQFTQSFTYGALNSTFGSVTDDTGTSPLNLVIAI